jgi:hypothetical protein
MSYVKLVEDILLEGFVQRAGKWAGSGIGRVGKFVSNNPGTSLAITGGTALAGGLLAKRHIDKQRAIQNRRLVATGLAAGATGFGLGYGTSKIGRTPPPQNRQRFPSTSKIKQSTSNSVNRVKRSPAVNDFITGLRKQFGV